MSPAPLWLERGPGATGGHLEHGTPLCGCCTWVTWGLCSLAVSPGPGSPFPLAPPGDGFGAGCFAAVLATGMGWGCLAGVGAAGARLNPSQQLLSWQMKRFMGLVRRKSVASSLRMLTPPEQSWRDVLATQCADLGSPVKTDGEKPERAQGMFPGTCGTRQRGTWWSWDPQGGHVGHG